MYIILNDNNNNPIPITESLHDFIADDFIFTQHASNKWINDIITFLISLKNNVITSIAIKDDENNNISVYNNLNHYIEEVKEFITSSPLREIEITQQLNVLKYNNE